MKAFVASSLLLCVWVGVAQGQTPPAPQLPASALSVEESTLLTQGWAFLAQGDLVRAVEKASAAMAISPRSQAALALAVEVEIARGGHATALRFYDQWLRGRALEEPAILRRIARALLQEIGADAQNPTARLTALQALAEDGDSWGLSVLRKLSLDNVAATRVLAETGDIDAVIELSRLVTESSGGGGGRLLGIRAIGQSGRPEAEAALLKLLGDVRPEVRAEAAAALADLSAIGSISALRPLVADPSAHVRNYVAAALYSLGDDSGLDLLLQHASSEFPGVRLGAAEALLVRPGTRGIELARELTTNPDPAIRLAAAHLLVRVDPDLVRGVISGPVPDNPALALERRRLALLAITDLGQLRAWITDPERPIRILAATRILSMTR